MEESLSIMLDLRELSKEEALNFIKAITRFDTKFVDPIFNIPIDEALMPVSIRIKETKDVIRVGRFFNSQKIYVIPFLADSEEMKIYYLVPLPLFDSKIVNEKNIQKIMYLREIKNAFVDLEVELVDFSKFTLPKNLMRIVLLGLSEENKNIIESLLRDLKQGNLDDIVSVFIALSLNPKTFEEEESKNENKKEEIGSNLTSFLKKRFKRYQSQVKRKDNKDSVLQKS